MEVKNDIAKSKIIYLDIMVNDRFYRQIPMRYYPLFPLLPEEVAEYAIDKIPSLANKEFTINFSSNRVY